MMVLKRIRRFGWQYKLFSLALIALVVGLILVIARYYLAAKWVLGSIALVESLPIVWDMWQDLRAGTYGIDLLAVTAIVTAVALGQDWAALLLVIMLTGGESLEDYAEHRAKSELDALLKRAPQMVHVIKGRKILELRASAVHSGDKILIKPGEVVPVDALIIEGIANFDESTLTGESLPQVKQVNDQILSGAINLDGAVTAKALRSAAESQYQQIIKLVRSASASKAPFVRLADRYSIPFTIASFAIAASVWLISGHAIRFLEVIVVATPCPLILAAPIALISGMSRASKFGIIVKTGSALEKLATAQVIAFDKTGTLTYGKPSVDRVLVYGNHSRGSVLGFAAGLEQNSRHVLARAVVDAAIKQGIKINKAKHVKEISGLGIEAKHGGKDILVGRLSLMEARAVQLPASFKRGMVQQTAAYVAVNGQLAGIITFKDELRSESSSTLSRIKNLGIKKTLMITGDNQATASAIAKKLGITDFQADALPADKLKAIEKVQQRPLVFVGDGVNDAPVLTAADVGIALGARGSTAASESADMVIMLDDISRVASALEIARRTFFIAKQSILMGIGISLVLMLIFATGKLPPLFGAIIQEVVDVVVIFNALRAHTAGRIKASA
ncbi:MAG TPA: heavy metal translocating P-type ATPase [Candidatus Dormibacteraeota bacterium]|nr:heavy metal translocating P-type ATPase [Candidatus Dormibacteraeota bacterium]